MIAACARAGRVLAGHLLEARQRAEPRNIGRKFFQAEAELGGGETKGERRRGDDQPGGKQRGQMVEENLPGKMDYVFGFQIAGAEMARKTASAQCAEKI